MTRVEWDIKPQLSQSTQTKRVWYG